jgi:hypothetical protein
LPWKMSEGSLRRWPRRHRHRGRYPPRRRQTRTTDAILCPGANGRLEGWASAQPFVASQYESSLSQDPISVVPGRDELGCRGRQLRRLLMGPGVTSPKSRPCRVESRSRRLRVVPGCPPGPSIGRRGAAVGRRRC